MVKTNSKSISIYDIKMDLPVGQVGQYTIEKFVVSQKEADFDRMRSMFSFGGGGRGLDPGTYYRLMRRSSPYSLLTEIVMSDTPAERQDLREVFSRAKGSILINGLGLGLVVEAVCQKPEVKDVTVIEISEDVIKLVGDHYLEKYKEKLTIIHADAFMWVPPKRKHYDIVWNDIWDNICSDNLKDMHKLHRKYGRKAGWVGSWCRDRCERLR